MGGEKIEDTSEFEVEDLKAEKVEWVDYICIKKCFWNKIYDVGDPLRFAGDDPMLGCFKVKEVGPVEEFAEDEEPTTLAGLVELEAQATIDSVNREGLDPESLDAGQAPVEGPSAEAGAEDLLE